MRKRLLFCSICAFLSISFSCFGGVPRHYCPNLTDPLVFLEGGLTFSADFDRAPGAEEPGALALSAAICELEAWRASDRAVRDSLLLAKAALLSDAGESARAYETVCRIPRFGLSEDQRAELIRRKLIYSWEAGLMDDFQVLLEEARTEGALEGTAANSAFEGTAANSATEAALSGKPRHRSPDAAMLLSIIPGAGLAYAGDWANAGKYFLLQGGSIALGAGAYLSGLYVSAFLGGGMLLYTTLMPATEKAIKAATEFNSRSLKAYYAPVYEALK